MSDSRSAQREENQSPIGWYYYSQGQAWWWDETHWVSLGNGNRVLGSDLPLQANNGVLAIGYRNGREWATGAPMVALYEPATARRIVLRGAVVAGVVTICVWLLGYVTWISCPWQDCPRTPIASSLE